jgi:hypothetical protein
MASRRRANGSRRQLRPVDSCIRATVGAGVGVGVGVMVAVGFADDFGDGAGVDDDAAAEVGAGVFP